MAVEILRPLTMIVVDILVIYALVAHGGRIDNDWRTTDRPTV